MKALIYATKAKPFLEKGGDPTCKDEYQLFDWVCDEDRKTKVLNGLIVAECDVKEAFVLISLPFCEKSYYVSKYCPESLTPSKIREMSCLSNMELVEYGKGKDLYAYHLENIKAIEPFPITDLYSDEACMELLTKAPQSYCFVYRKVYIDESEIKCTTDENDPAMVYAYTDGSEKDCFCEDDGRFYRVEKYLVFSVRSPYVALELNIDSDTGKPFKDLEIRKTRIANSEIKYK